MKRWVSAAAFAFLCAACSKIAAPVHQASAPSAETSSTTATTQVMATTQVTLTTIATTTATATTAAADCGMSLCGCWTPSHLAFATRLQDNAGQPASGIDATCHGDSTPIAHSDAQGRLSFEIDTPYSPGCHWQRCTNLSFSDPQHRFADKPTTVFLANGKTVTLLAAH